MFISDFAIKRPIITVVTMIALVVFGLAALARLDTDEFPAIDSPIVFVAIAYPGASPDVVEREVVSRLEDKISGISGVDKINSTSRDGFAQILVQFVFSKPVDQATQDIRDAISAVRMQLPAEILEPIIQRFDPNQLPIVSLALTSTVLSTPQLTALADPTIAGDLRSIAGVAQVNVVGGDSAQLSINVRPTDLAAFGVGIDQVVNAVRAQNLAAPVGQVNSALEQRSIRLEGRFEHPEEFNQLVVAQRGGQLITLGQVAIVQAGAAEPTSAALFNGTQAIGLDIVKSREYSTTAVADLVKARIAQLQKTLPAGTRLEVVRDAGDRVRHSVRNVEEALVEGALLTVLVVFLFLNSWRSTVITGLALPVSVLTSFVPLAIFGFTLNTMSLLGLSLAIGILIDDAIVVRENIVRHVEMGKDHYTASREGTDEIGLAVAATTFSILAVFVPIGFMPGIGGQWFKPFALTIACSVLVSLFVSFSLDPMLSAYWADPHRPEHEKSRITKLLDRFNHWFNRQAQNYKKVIAWALDHRAAMITIAAGAFVSAFVLPAKGMTGLAGAVIGVVIIAYAFARTGVDPVVRGAIAVAGLVVAVVLVRAVPAVRTVGVGFFPEDDRAEMTIALETPPGSNLAYTRLKAEEAARVARSHKEVLYTYTTLGSSSIGTVDEGNIYVRLVPKNQRSISAEQFANMLRKETKRVAGVTLSVFTSDFGGGRKQLQMQLRGNDLVALNQAAEMVKEEVARVPGAVDIGLSTKGQKPELNVELNRGVAGSMGITVGEVAQALRPAFAGLKAGDWVDPSGETRDVEVRLSPESRRRAADLAALPLVVAGPNGVPSTLPLGQVATIRESTGPAIIDHLDRELVVTVEANTSGRASGDVAADIEARVKKLTLPPGVRYSMGGEAKDQNEVFGQIFFALGVALMLMYLILVVQFGSFLDPVAIMISLPLSLIGVMVSLAITGNTINIMTLIGVMMLMGIVAKNAILLIDFAKWAREKDGKPLREALIEAGSIRLRPILMTTFALIAGMIPVALGRGEGAQFRAPLGIAVIGGVITSTFLTLLVIPTGYEILDEWRRAFSRFFGYRPRQMTAEHPVPAMGD